MSESLILLPSTGALFLLLGCLVQFHCDRLCFILSLFCSVLLFLEAYPFLMRERTGVDQDGRGSVKEVGGVKLRDTIM